MRIRLAELQRQYKEKQKQLSKIQPRKEKESPKDNKEKDKANKRILRSLSFDNNGLVKPSCRTVALYGPFGFFLRYGGLSMGRRFDITM
jgi:hypothetical protein